MRDITLVILAGGLATRIRPITNNKAKALIEINGKPFIYWQLKYYIKQGVKNFVFLLGFKGEEIEGYIKKNNYFNVNISFYYDGNQLRGTGGSILQSINKFPENFFVLYGDTLLQIDLNDMYNFYDKNNHQITMSIYKNKSMYDKSNVQKLSHNKITYNKDNLQNDMSYIDYGISILNKKIFISNTDKTLTDLSSFYKGISSKNKLFGYEVFKRFYEIGSFEGIKQTQSFVKENLSLFE